MCLDRKLLELKINMINSGIHVMYSRVQALLYMVEDEQYLEEFVPQIRNACTEFEKMFSLTKEAYLSADDIVCSGIYQELVTKFHSTTKRIVTMSEEIAEIATLSQLQRVRKKANCLKRLAMESAEDIEQDFFDRL